MGRRLPRLIWAAPLAAALVASLAATGDLPSSEGPAVRSISGRLDDGLSTVLIESTEPVAYLTSQPDPLTVFVDLRNARADALGARPLGEMPPPVTAVNVERATAPDGSPVTRVRVSLDHAAGHRVRSSRNVIYVEVDRNTQSSKAHANAATAKKALYQEASGSQSPVREDRPVITNTDTGAVATTDPAPASAPAFSAGSAAAAVLQQPAAPAPVLQTPSVSPATETTRQFTGHPVTFDFQGADLRAVLRTFAEISGLNIVIDPTIQGTVDVSLREVPWDQALDIILKANKLGYSVDGTIVRIAPLQVLAAESEERRKLAETQALAGELRVLTHPLSYAKAADLVQIITNSALSSRGEVQVDARTNTLIIRDLADRLTAAADLINTLDRPQPQVEIEARIVQTSRDFARALGVQWGFNGRLDPALGNTTNLAFPNSAAVGGRVGSQQGPAGTDTGVNLPVSAATSAVGLALGSINGALNLDVALTALERSGKGRLLSTPRVSTQNNVEAEITQGVQIPIQTQANNTVTVTFKDAALQLRVTPQITAAGTVIMRITLENAAPDYSRSVNGIPPIDTQRAVTSVLVTDGETTVIGGIYTSREQMTEGRTPLLHRIPLLGWLFKRDEMSDESRELLIFITPRITKG
jgi:type IV pilus assembly protein PilQ